MALGFGIAVNAVLGPLVLDRIDYPVTATMRNQTIGLDAASLLVAAPLTAAVGAGIVRGWRWGPELALGPGAYAAYMFAQFIVGPDHLTYPTVLVLQLAIFVGGWLLAALAWHLTRKIGAVDPVERWHGYVAWALAGFVLLRYVPGLIGSVDNQPLPEEAAGDPAMYWLIVLLDLGVFVPVAAITGAGVRGRVRWAASLHRGLVVWFALVTVAVATMSATMLINDDPYASAAQLGLFVGIGVLMVGYCAALFRSPSGSSARRALGR